jgi:hypothetical protein
MERADHINERAIEIRIRARQEGVRTGDVFVDFFDFWRP